VFANVRERARTSPWFAPSSAASPAATCYALTGGTH